MDPRLNAGLTAACLRQLIAGCFALSILSELGFVFVAERVQSAPAQSCPAPLVCHIAMVQ